MGFWLFVAVVAIGVWFLWTKKFKNGHASAHKSTSFSPQKNEEKERRFEPPSGCQILVLEDASGDTARLFFKRPSPRELDTILSRHLSVGDFWDKHFIGWEGLTDERGHPIPVERRFKNYLLRNVTFMEMVADVVQSLPDGHELKWLDDCWGFNTKTPPHVSGGGVFEFISDKINGIVYEKIFADIVGIRYDNPDGTPRRENFWGLDQGDQVYLFRHKDNPKDKNAVAVFPSYVPTGQLTVSDQLGFLPREVAKDVVARVEKGFSVVAEIDYLKEWYLSRDEWMEDPRYDCRLRLKFFIPDSAEIQDLLRFKFGLQPSVVKVLMDAGISSISDLSRMSDKELLAIKGLGPKALERIRNNC